MGQLGPRALVARPHGTPFERWSWRTESPFPSMSPRAERRARTTDGARAPTTQIGTSEAGQVTPASASRQLEGAGCCWRNTECPIGAEVQRSLVRTRGQASTTRAFRRGKTCSSNVCTASTLSSMVSRIRSLAPDAGMPAGLMVPRNLGRAGPLSLRESIPPGPARERVVAAMREKMKRRAATLSEAMSRLREIVLTHDPVVLIESIALPASSGALGLDVEDDAPATTTWDAKIEYLQGLALSGPPGTAEVSEAVTEEAIDALGAVFDAANADLFIRSIEEGRSNHGALDATSFLLRLEAMSDRMAGYPVHLERIDAAVFDPHHDFYVQSVGFCPSDLIRLVRRHVRAINSTMQLAMAGFADAAARGPLRADDKEAADAVKAFYTTMTTANRWTVDTITESSGLQRDQVAAALNAASVEFGCQPEFRSPFDSNEALVRPLIRLDEESFFAPLPWSLGHNVHGLVRAVVAHDPQVAAAYQRHRADATERLINEALQPVFGADFVHRGQHFNSSIGAGEVDCLVSGTRAWCIEGKSQSLTEPARRGHRPRIERITKDVVRTALAQTERAATYIMGDGRRD